jgi:hypothetical protein
VVTAAGHMRANVSYGVAVLSRLLSWLSSLTDPRAYDQDTRVTGLCLINIAFEAGGEGLGMFPSLVSVSQVCVCSNFVLLSCRTVSWVRPFCLSAVCCTPCCAVCLPSSLLSLLLKFW